LPKKKTTPVIFSVVSLDNRNYETIFNRDYSTNFICG